MKNFIQHGLTLPLPAPYAVTSGQGVLVGAIFGVAAYDALSGETVEIKRDGCFSLPCLGTDTVAVGARLYWDNTNRRLTTTATNNTQVGAAIAAKASGVTTVSVLLDSTIR